MLSGGISSLAMMQTAASMKQTETRATDSCSAEKRNAAKSDEMSWPLCAPAAMMPKTRFASAFECSDAIRAQNVLMRKRENVPMKHAKPKLTSAVKLVLAVAVVVPPPMLLLLLLLAACMLLLLAVALVLGLSGASRNAAANATRTEPRKR